MARRLGELVAQQCLDLAGHIGRAVEDFEDLAGQDRGAVWCRKGVEDFRERGYMARS
jgi:hypothetical protein